MEPGDPRRWRRAFDSAALACRNLRLDRDEDRSRLARRMTIGAAAYPEAAGRPIVARYVDRLIRGPRKARFP